MFILCADNPSAIPPSSNVVPLTVTGALEDRKDTVLS